MTLPDGYRLRAAQTSDLADLQKVDLAASRLFEPTGLIHEVGGPVPIPGEVLASGLSSDLLFVTTDPFGAAVGFSLARVKGNDLYLDQISVDPAHGKRGLGAALLTRIIEEADTRRLKGVILSTFRDLEWNGPFYRKFGFVELPRSKVKRWMKDLEKIQAETMDVSLRCFMRRPGAWDRRWFPLPRARKTETPTPALTGASTS